MDFSWIPQFWPLILYGLWLTIVLLVLSCFFGMLLAVPIGLVQVTGPRPLAWLASGFCTRHPRHAAAHPALASLLRPGLALSPDSVDPQELHVAGAARGILLCGARLHAELRGLLRAPS